MATASDLRCRIQLYCLEKSENELGETVPDYKPDRVVWANIVPTSGRSGSLEGDVERMEVTHKVTLRAGSLPEIQNGMRFTFRSQWYEVLYGYPIYNRAGWLELYCRLVVEDHVKSH